MMDPDIRRYLDAPSSASFDPGARYYKAMLYVGSRQLCKPPPCKSDPIGLEHEIRIGDMARVEQGTIDGVRATVYCCTDCLDNYLKERK
jgi:hypothetical protein